MPGLWALGASKRNSILSSELSNYDFWVNERAKSFLEKLQEMVTAYQAAFYAEDVEADLTDTSIIPLLTKYSVRVQNKYYGICHGTNSTWYGYTYEECYTSEAFKKLNDTANELQDSIVNNLDPQIVSDLAQQLEFHFSDIVMIVRHRLARGKGLFNFLVFRKPYWKED